jgi:transcriptional regulator with GAF, ATPase, and Fis domain
MLTDISHKITRYLSVKMTDMDQEKISVLEKENARLKNIVAELSLLNDLSRAMSSAMRVQDVMAAIITKSIQTIGVEQGTILLVEENSQSLLKTLIRGVGEEHQGKFYKTGEYLTGWMLKNRKPFLCNDISDERLQGLKLENSKVSSILSVPMILRGKFIGVINLFNKSGAAGFTENDQKLMSIIATQVAAFLANARSFEAVQESRELLQKQAIHLQKEVGSCYGFAGIIGQSERMQAVKQELKTISETTASVLIVGETGTGKELAAKTIHYNSDRRDKSFVDVNSAAIPENLVESEFFGIEEGVATGVNKRIGLFEQANHGTLFIDEIGDMSMASQSKILRVLQEKQFRRVGSSHNSNVDIRIIAATHKNLKEAVANGSFREDLYYRLCVFEINLPPLRQRKEDIPLLANHFLKLCAKKMGKAVSGFSPQAIKNLVSHQWPGNIRELANVIERAAILTDGAIVQTDHLPVELRNKTLPQSSRPESFEASVNIFKKQLVQKSLLESNNNKAEAARKLKISRAYFHRLLNQFELNE